MIFTNPGPEKREIFAGCKKPGVYSILIKPNGVAPFRSPTTGQAPHLRYDVSGTSDQKGTGTGLEYEAINNSATDFVDRLFSVEFDGGTFCLNTSGALYLVGGDPAGSCDIELFHHLELKPVLHWHSLMTRLEGVGVALLSMTIPNFHTEVSSWQNAAGITLEGDPILLTPGLYSKCIPGTTLVNGRGVVAMIVTQWWG